MREMKITGIDAYPVGGEMRFPGKGLATPYDIVIVRVTTDAGICGFGEAPAHTASLGDGRDAIIWLLRQYEAALDGVSAWQLAKMHKRMLAINGGLSGRIPDAARCAVDIAVHDVLGKAVGQPVYAILNGGLRSEFGALGTEFGRTVEEKVEHVQRYLGAGYAGLEVKVRIDDGLDLCEVRRQCDMLRSVLEVTPTSVEVIADMNQRWGAAKNSILMAHSLLAGYSNLYFEQPVHYADLAGMATIRAAIPYPVIADESATGPEVLIDIVRRQAADMISIKLARVGGLYPAMQMLTIAEAAGIEIRTDTAPNGHIGDTATAHLAACVRIPHPVSDGWTWFTPDVVSGGVQLGGDGVIRISEAPGLGIDVDLASLERARQAG